MTKDERIEKQEAKYRRFIKNYLTDKTTNRNLILNIVPTPVENGVDSCVTATTANHQITYSIEIKERMKDFNSFPYAELKLSKYNHMVQEFEKNKHDRLLYVVVSPSNSYVYVFNLTEGMDGYKTFDWKIKKTQYEDNSKMITVKAYKLPLSTCVYKQKLDNINAVYN